MAEYALRVYGTQKRLIDAYDLQSERVFGVFVCVFLCLDEFVSEKNERQKKWKRRENRQFIYKYRTNDIDTTEQHRFKRPM